MTQNTDLEKKLDSLQNRNSLIFNRGIERETLRVDPHGNLSSNPHPDFLGSKLCHPTITADFSEAQPELITPVSQSIDQTLKTLNDTHRFIYSGLHDEILWSASMPCVLNGDSNIPLARYGNSNLGNLKTTYRNGLGNRYGRSMQTICAVHYNFSFSDRLWQELAAIENTVNTSSYRTRRYFDLMRNFRRFSWLAIYLMGSSPAVCNSFVKGREHNLEKFDEGCLYLPGATSLRSGNLGYQSDAQSDSINICYNSLENYVSNLVDAVVTPYGPYTKIGTIRDDEYLQINDCVLQSEAEFYTTIRAKRVPPKGANFLQVLLEEGVEYIEVRLLDVNPFEPLGIGADTIQFLDTLLLYCLLIDSPVHDDPLCQAVKTNLNEVVHHGRESATQLVDQGTHRSLDHWGAEILNDLLLTAGKLDQMAGNDSHRTTIQLQQQKLVDPELTPSGRILKDMKSESIPFFRFAMNKAISHKNHFLDQPLTKQEQDYFAEIAENSIRDQRYIEQADTEDFDTYLKKIKQQYVDMT